MISQILQIKNIPYFIFIISLLVLISLIQQELFLEKEISSMMLDTVVDKTEMLSFIKKIKWISLLIIPIIVIVRVAYSAGCMFVGGVYDSNSNVKYKDMFNIALKCDIVFLLYVLYNFILLLTVDVGNLTNVSRYSSFAYFFNIATIEQWILVPVMALNIFEILYWFLLSKFYSVFYRKTFWESFKFVMSTYGTGLFIYIIFSMFIILYVQS